MTKPNQDGTTIVYVMWILFLALLTGLSWYLLRQQHNPNQTVETTVGDLGTKTVVLKQNRQNHYVATGQINGKAAEFLVDTGATWISVPIKHEQRLGLRRGISLRIDTAGGTVDAFATRLRKVSLGEITIKDVPATINPHSSSDTVLLGMAFLARLDFQQKEGLLILSQKHSK